MQEAQAESQADLLEQKRRETCRKQPQNPLLQQSITGASLDSHRGRARALAPEGDIWRDVPESPALPLALSLPRKSQLRAGAGTGSAASSPASLFEGFTHQIPRDLLGPAGWDRVHPAHGFVTVTVG